MAVTRLLAYLSCFFFLTLSITVNATVLPEDRLDIMYHKYDGGGITIDGPSVLVRKSIGDQVSISANYYVDNIVSASIDAVTQASPYTENRVQTSIGADYLHEKSILSYSYTDSTENDYEAITQSFGISQEMFGGLTTISLGYSFGDNIVTQTGAPDFMEPATFKNYRASVAQVLTKNLIMSFNYDIITDEGFLNNPYRRVRHLSPSAPLGYIFKPTVDENDRGEKYPETRTTNAASLGFRYYLPYRAALFGSYRFFSDSWSIRADTFEIGYVHPLEEKWTFEVSYRYYTQDQASFYSDLFPDFDVVRPEFYARDKELSTFTDDSINIGVTYELDNIPLFERGTANFFYSYMSFDYENFRDVRVTSSTPGTEPLYSFSAGITRIFFSFWF